MNAELPPERLSLALVLEEHLGHRTFSANLRSAFDAHAELAAHWVPVTYEAARPFRALLPDQVAAALGGRREVRRGLRGLDARAVLFNTQVPAVLGGSAARSRPYIAVTDITPVQYDAMAEHYGHRVDSNPLVRRAKHRASQRVFRRAAMCVGWSTWVRDSLIADYGVDPAHTAVVPPGVDLDRWKPGPSPVRDPARFRVLFVGGDFHRKGGPTLLAALEHLPESVEMVAVTKSVVPPTPRVHVVDDLGPNDPRLIELYQSADVFVLPTMAEAFGIAAIEAAAVGLPAVVSAVGGLVDVVEPGVTGFTVPPGDVAALADRLLRLHGAPTERAAMAVAARARAERRFDAAANGARLVTLLREAAGA